MPGMAAGATVVPKFNPGILLKISAPSAPTAAAFVILSANEHVPRCMRAIDPAGKPAKSGASQPLSKENASTPNRGAVTLPITGGFSTPKLKKSGDQRRADAGV